MPEDLLQCVEQPSIPLANELMSICDLTIATGGPAMVKAAYGSGKPAYGVGAGNATMVIDETADIDEAARNTRDQQDQRPRLGLFGRRQPAGRRVDLRRVARSSCRPRAAISSTPSEKQQLQRGLLGRRRAAARPTPLPGRPRSSPRRPDSRSPTTRRSSSSKRRRSASTHLFSTEKLGVVLAIFKAHGFDDALDMVRQIFETGGRGHSCGIYSFNDDHIHRLALMAPVSRIMVRQVQSSSNAGTFTNGMPMTSSMGCGVWGGNITNENISLKHYMNVTWVSRPIAEDQPSEAELFGEFYNTPDHGLIERAHHGHCCPDRRQARHARSRDAHRRLPADRLPRAPRRRGDLRPVRPHRHRRSSTRSARAASASSRPATSRWRRTPPTATRARPARSACC